MKIGLVVVNAVLACILLVAVAFVILNDPLNFLIHYPRLINLMPVAMTALIAVSNAVMFVRARKEMDADLTFLTRRIAELEEKLEKKGY